MNKRLLSLALILCILLTSIYIPNKSMAVSVGDINIYEGIQAQISFELIKRELPPGTKESITVRGQKLKLNTELWIDKGIVVYGDYQVANPSDRDYKKGTQNPNKKPYYKFGEGEYRYHGYTAEGNKHTNVHFINDANSNRELADKQWVHNPWDDSRVPSKPLRSAWNESAIRDGNKTVQQVINNAFDWNINNGTVAGQSNKYHYLNVLSPPTTRSSGEGQMWHRSLNTGKIWYQTFSIKPIKPNIKKQVPVETTIKILDKDKLVLNGGMSFIKVKVEVEGVLDDSITLNGANAKVNKTIYYNREDISDWDFDLNGTHIGSNKSKEDRKNAPNKGIKIYEFTLTREQIESNNKLSFNVKTNANFWDGVKSNSATATDTATVKLDKQVPKGFKSLFTVNNTINIDNKKIFLEKEKINYLNGSYGEITKYVIKIRDEATDEITTVNINGKDIDNNQLNIAIFEVMNKQAKDKTSGLASFEVIQTAFNNKGDSDSHVERITLAVKQPPTPPVIFTEKIEAEPNIPEYAFDIVPFKPTIAGDVDELSTKSVLVDGVEVNFNHFFSGNFVFGESDVDKLVKIELNLGLDSSSIDTLTSNHIKWVQVFTTKPKVQYKLEGSFKQNRKMTVINNSLKDNINSPTLLSEYPISYNWKFEQIDGDNSSFRIRNSDNMYKEFLYKEPGQYRITLTGENELGRKSEPYTLDIYIHEDYEPTVEWYIWNNVLARNEEFSMFHEVASTDGDVITKNIIEVWYDSNDNGVPNQKLMTVNAKDFTKYKPSKLGQYTVRNIIEEDFGEDTLAEFITAEDKVKRIVEREVLVDNLSPMTQIYVEEYSKFPELDVFIMNDKDLARNKNDIIRNKRMDYINYLRNNSLEGKVEVWDMHTYVHSQSASTTRNSGSSYPSNSISYSSGGYSGTLNRYSVHNNDYWIDTSYYKTVTETTTEEINHYMETDGNGNPGSPWRYRDGWVDSNGNAVMAWEWTETVTTTTTREVLVSDGYWEDDYTGYYSGTIYKSVRQPYTDPFRPSSDKYIIYISDSSINEIWDLRDMMNKTDAKLILIGGDSIKSQISHHHFIKNAGSIEDLVKQALDKIIKENPYNLQYTILKNEKLKTNVVDLDDENDPIIEKKFQYVHDINYYDNFEGLFSLATPEYSDTKWIDTKVESYNKIGYYQMIRRTKDRPLERPSLGKYSNEHLINIYVHRKPIALASLDWTYDLAKSSYKTTWVDKSYDLDHQFKRADRGIIDRKIKFRKSGGDWNYKIPSYLDYGTYNLEYYVKDVEGVWSDAFTMNFTLQPSPPIQMKAQARTLDTKFRMNSIPASEKLELYDIWTRYPQNIKLEVAMYKDNVQKTATQSINYSSSTGTKSGSDITWKNIVHTIPATLPDSSYILRIKAIGVGGDVGQRDFPVLVNTPINLLPTSFEEINTESVAPVHATTTKYANEVSVIMQSGTPYANNLNMVGKLSGDSKKWDINYNVPANIPEGMYQAKFIAKTPNGNQEIKSITYKVIAVKLTDLRISGVYDIAWEYLFQNENKVPTNYKIGVESMPIKTNSKSKPIKVGYKVEFEVDSIGLNNHGDQVSVEVKFLDKFGNLVIPNHKSRNNSNVSIPNIYKEFYAKRISASGNKGVWEFSYYLPATTLVAGKDELVIHMTVVGTKSTGTSYNFNTKTGFHGKVFSYNLNNSALEDYYLRGGN